MKKMFRGWGLRLLLTLSIVQIIVSWLPNKAEANVVTTRDRVNDARYVLASAAENNPDYPKHLLTILHALTSTVVVSLPVGADYAHCKKFNIYAYYNPYTKMIHLCERVMKESSDRIVQTIIHEAAHAAGYASECDATRISIIAMMAARRVANEVGYQCVL
ncbi:MAG: hypothetical protein H7326_10290 [Bdellovibrionaceae bacterium]|nr:hypothetical protein [Pseudobdellovibrionaceae bacterium]